MLLLVHDIPGRLRFVVPNIKGDRHGAARLRADIHKLDGVSTATVNVRTCSLIIVYDATAETRERVIHHLGTRPQGCLQPPAGEGPPIADAIANSLAQLVAERLIRFAVTALV
jgi:hypothetical protein